MALCMHRGAKAVMQRLRLQPKRLGNFRTRTISQEWHTYLQCQIANPDADSSQLLGILQEQINRPFSARCNKTASVPKAVKTCLPVGFHNDV